MSTSIHVDILNLLRDNKETLGIPDNVTLQMDFLPSSGDALSYQPDQAPKTEKQWINGTRRNGLTFSVLAVTDGDSTSAPNIKAAGWLEAIGALFGGMNNFALSEQRTVIQGNVETPAILRRTEDNRVVYSILIEITYKE